MTAPAARLLATQISTSQKACLGLHWKLSLRMLGFLSFRSKIICPKRPFAHENLWHGKKETVSNATPLLVIVPSLEELLGGVNLPLPRPVTLVERVDALVDQA